MKEGEEKGKMNIGGEVAQKKRREGENKVSKLLVATVGGSTSSK